ncbi:MAG: cold shock domain-containing protein [Acidimicrobiales bacterium]
MNGSVAAFDRHAGHGTVRANEGGEFFLHCTAISDGSRTIEVDTAVTFHVVPGHNGRWEAAAVTPSRTGR